LLPRDYRSSYNPPIILLLCPKEELAMRIDCPVNILAGEKINRRKDWQEKRWTGEEYGREKRKAG
jgi:hypothetical protein